jgi:hypothetical protein
MRLESEAPQTDFEKVIEIILTNNGIKQDEIQFRQCDRYLRVGYWGRLSNNIMSQLSGMIKEEVDVYDDDCGTLYFYRLNH